MSSNSFNSQIQALCCIQLKRPVILSNKLELSIGLHPRLEHHYYGNSSFNSTFQNWLRAPAMRSALPLQQNKPTAVGCSPSPQCVTVNWVNSCYKICHSDTPTWAAWTRCRGSKLVINAVTWDNSSAAARNPQSISEPATRARTAGVHAALSTSGNMSTLSVSCMGYNIMPRCRHASVFPSEWK